MDKTKFLKTDCFVPEEHLGDLTGDHVICGPPYYPERVAYSNGTDVHLIEKFKTKPPSQLFVDIDPQEKLDNEDPGWDHIRKLKTDKERYEAVRACWGSHTVPNPHRNLTYHSFRRYRLLKEGISSAQNNTKYDKRAAVEDLGGNKAKRSRTHTVLCTTTVDNEIYHLKQEYSHRLSSLNVEYGMKEEELIAKYRNARQLLLHNFKNKYAFNEEVSRVCNAGGGGDLLWNLENTEKHQRESLNKELDYKRNNLWSEVLSNRKKLEAARSEIYMFCSFYQGLGGNGNTTRLSMSHQAELSGTDMMYILYKKFYCE